MNICCPIFFFSLAGGGCWVWWSAAPPPRPCSSALPSAAPPVGVGDTSLTRAGVDSSYYSFVVSILLGISATSYQNKLRDEGGAFQSIVLMGLKK